MHRPVTLLALGIVLAVNLLARAQQRSADDLADDAKARQVGVLPIGDDGKPVNTDFETGDLRDWTTTGAAFDGQPIKGDTVNVRRGDMHSRHAGNYWIGTYEVRADAPRGTLTSKPFKVTQPWAMFFVGGGAIPRPRALCARVSTSLRRIQLKLCGGIRTR